MGSEGAFHSDDEPYDFWSSSLIIELFRRTRSISGPVFLALSTLIFYIIDFVLNPRANIPDSQVIVIDQPLSATCRQEWKSMTESALISEIKYMIQIAEFNQILYFFSAPAFYNVV
jgi:hypothetical protein